MTTVKIIHNAGLFSCFSKRLEGVVWFFNTNKNLPDQLDSSQQFSFYKSNPSDDISPLYFKENKMNIEYKRTVRFHNDEQFLAYKKLDFNGLQPFVEKYFSPSEHVEEVVSMYEKKYAIDYGNTCGVFYRGNDKFTETSVASHEIFISKAREVKKQNPTVTFLVQTDEAEFLEAFLDEFPGSVSFEEMTPMSKKNSFIAVELPLTERVEHGIHFFGAIILLSKCNSLITHSGNGSLWCVLYRGNAENIHQCLNNSWNTDGNDVYSVWYTYKRYIKSMFKKHSYWSIIKS